MKSPDETPGMPGPWPDVLAAYADGELDPAARAVVERWLACCPGAMNELQAQRELSPGNWPLWQQAEPPLPSEASWKSVRDGVLAGLESPLMPASTRQRKWWLRAGVYFAGGVAAAVAAFVIISVMANRVPPPSEVVPFEAPDSLAEYAVLPMATDADVDIERMAGDGAGWLPIGNVPLNGPLALASADDVQLEEAEPHPAWPTGTPRMTTGPGDAPMIYAAKPR